MVTETDPSTRGDPAASVDWEMIQSGPSDAEHTVLLLPGGMCSARSWREVMAEPALARTRLVAVTMPGHAGTPPPDDVSNEHYAQLTSELAGQVGAEVVVGFSMGAVVALEMLASGGFAGPAVLLGLTLSPKDEPAFFRALIRLGSVLGTLPASVLRSGAASMVKRIPVPPERQAELRADFRRNSTRSMRSSLHEYLRWLHRYPNPAQRLCDAGTPVWVVHAEKGDGRLTDQERRTLEACPHVRVVTIPGEVFFLPNEIPQRVAEIVVEALAQA
jgi:pimeloyl-ACP methyl ester carboxylesterase